MSMTEHHDDAAADDGYTLQIDAWLRRPDVRITRALRTDEWSTAPELFNGLELDRSAWSEYFIVLTRLVLAGNVRMLAGQSTRYQLARALERPRPESRHPPELPGFEGEDRRGWFFWRGAWRKS